MSWESANGGRIPPCLTEASYRSSRVARPGRRRMSRPPSDVDPVALHYREERKLALESGSHPRGLAFLSAASGLVRVRDRLYVIADDEFHLGVFSVDGERAGEARPLARRRPAGIGQEEKGAQARLRNLAASSCKRRESRRVAPGPRLGLAAEPVRRRAGEPRRPRRRARTGAAGRPEAALCRHLRAHSPSSTSKALSSAANRSCCCSAAAAPTRARRSATTSPRSWRGWPGGGRARCARAACAASTSALPAAFRSLSPTARRSATARGSSARSPKTATTVTTMVPASPPGSASAAATMSCARSSGSSRRARSRASRPAWSARRCCSAS